MSYLFLDTLNVDFFELIISGVISGLVDDETIDDRTDQNEDFHNKGVPVVDREYGHHRNDEAVSHYDSDVGLLYANYAEHCDHNH